jgi:hypothetical protein
MVDQVLLEDHAQQREQQPRVAVRPDRDVLEFARRLGPARVEHHDAAAAALDLAHPVAHARDRQHRAVRDERVGPEHHEQVGPQHVGDRDGQRRAV